MNLLAEGGLSELLAVSAMAIMIAVLLLRSYRRTSRKGGGNSPLVRTPRPGPNTPSPGRASGDAARWEVEMHDVARDLSGQLDSKMGALEHLIREADRAAARLEKALSKADGQEGPATRTPQGPKPASPADQADKLKMAGQPYPSPDFPAGGGERSKHDEIYALSDYGLPASEIAQRVGSPVGEVELILGLRDKR